MESKVLLSMERDLEQMTGGVAADARLLNLVDEIDKAELAAWDATERAEDLELAARTKYGSEDAAPPAVQKAIRKPREIEDARDNTARSLFWTFCNTPATTPAGLLAKLNVLVEGEPDDWRERARNPNDRYQDTKALYFLECDLRRLVSESA